jgi:colicin import membrane protein
MKRHVLALLLAGSATVLAQPATRAEVQAQRAAIEQRFAREQAECEQRFVVSTCTEALRQRRREALAPLVAREHELAAEERRGRAAAQAQRVQERGQAAVQEEGQHRERLVPAAPVTPASHPPRARSPEEATRAQRQAALGAESEAAKRREQARERAQRQRERITEHEARQQRRSKPPAAPLPMPGVAPASAASR